MQKRIFKILRHSLVWVFFLGLPFIIFYDLSNATGRVLLEHITSSPFYWIFSLSFILLFYSNLYYFIPKLYLKRKYGYYILTVVLLFVFFYLVKPFELMFRYYYVSIGKEVNPFNFLQIDLFSCVFFIVIITGTMIVQVVRQWHITEIRALQSEAEKLNAELSFLQAQINPHFLFNTLNNIYSLSLDQCPETSDAIIKLSNTMRYITDEANKDLVPLGSEIDCLSDYIDLHKLRLYKNITVDFSVSGDVERKQIAPLILMTYVENAFKFGISSYEEARITIKLQVDESRINFFCQNKIFGLPRVIERTGVGLINTKKRLKHLYPNKHDLTITSNNGLYTVDLTLYA